MSGFGCGVISAFGYVVVDLCILCILVLGLVLGCSGLFAFWFAVWVMVVGLFVLVCFDCVCFVFLVAYWLCLILCFGLLF